MSTENEIRSRLQTGFTPNDVIQQGYKRSTVYKVFNRLRTFSGCVRKPDWVIEDIIFDQANVRYLPGDLVHFTFDVVNLSSYDLYVVNIGIQTEWMIQDNVWSRQSVNDILKPGQKRKISLNFGVPKSIALGEYELLFGLEGQYLPVQGYPGTSLVTLWTEPIIINIKYQLTGESIFLSHSTKDMQLVRQLEAYLDNYGIQVLIGEDNEQPGRILGDKFMEMIRSSTIFLGILTDAAVRSVMVRNEISYAVKIRKPCVLLKEESVTLDWDAEWIPFSKYDEPISVFQTIMAAVENIKKDRVILASPLIGILGVGLISFILGLSLRK